MIYGIDHAVIILPNLDDAIELAQAAGFTVVAGGTHADGSTHNALIGFADGTYLELISPTGDTTRNPHRWFGRLDHGGGLVDFCLLSDRLSADVALMRERDRIYSPALEAGRNRLDGVRLQWKGSFPPGQIGETGWPFLIEDVTPRILRVPQAPMQVQHPNGARGIREIIVLVENLAGSIADYEAICGVEAGPPEGDTEFGGTRASLSFPNHRITLVQPAHEQWLAHLNRLGPGPVSLRLHSGDTSMAEGTHLELGTKDGTSITLT